jgi:metal-responsive CopG/Arc/MetJ family transcriptional regulator
MQLRISVTLSEEIVREMDVLADPSSNRSEFVETAVRRFIEQLHRERRNASDLAVINRKARQLNREAADVLEFQVMRGNRTAIPRASSPNRQGPFS